MFVVAVVRTHSSQLFTNGIEMITRQEAKLSQTGRAAAAQY